MEQSGISSDARLSGAVESGYETLVKQSPDGVYELSVLVGGVHCANCIQKIESTLAREQNVKGARLNFSNRCLSIRWIGSADLANGYVSKVENLGYSVQPYSDQAEKNETKAQEKLLLLCLGVAGFAMGNIMLLSVGLWATSIETMGMATRDLMHWISALIALPAVIFSGRPFFYSAFKVLRAGVPIWMFLFLWLLYLRLP